MPASRLQGFAASALLLFIQTILKHQSNHFGRLHNHASELLWPTQSTWRLNLVQYDISTDLWFETQTFEFLFEISPLNVAGQQQDSSQQQPGFLKEPELRKCLVKLAHTEEWMASLLQSHPESAARTEAIAGLEREVAILREQLGKAFPGVGMEEWARELQQTHATAWF